MEPIGNAIVSVLLAVIGVAIIAVLVSGQAQTANVLSAGGTAISKVLGSALSPVTGATSSGVTINPTSFTGGNLPTITF